jgi:hypothetical protein
VTRSNGPSTAPAIHTRFTAPYEESARGNEPVALPVASDMPVTGEAEMLDACVTVTTSNNVLKNVC